jgi:hypothetical protein
MPNNNDLKNSRIQFLELKLFTFIVKNNQINLSSDVKDFSLGEAEE